MAPAGGESPVQSAYMRGAVTAALSWLKWRIHSLTSFLSPDFLPESLSSQTDLKPVAGESLGLPLEVSTWNREEGRAGGKCVWRNTPRIWDTMPVRNCTTGSKYVRKKSHSGTNEPVMLERKLQERRSGTILMIWSQILKTPFLYHRFEQIVASLIWYFTT